MRICSLLPSATEILYALGLGDSVVGVTHECDFPPEAAAKPALIRPRVDPKAAPAEIDREVSELVARGESIYAVDAELLAKVAPDLIVTQDLCHVCAASPDDLATALTRLPKMPEVLSLTPHGLADVWGDIRRVGKATGRRERAEKLAASLESEVAAIAAKTQRAETRPRVLCLEWMEPYYVGGHWVPEMVALAGGEDIFGRAGEASFRVTPEQVAGSRAEILVVMPCGYAVERAAEEFRAVRCAPEWRELPAVREGRVFAVDANGYFRVLARGWRRVWKCWHGFFIRGCLRIPRAAMECSEWRPRLPGRRNNLTMFREEIPVNVGEIVERDGFVFADLLPVERAASASL